MAELTPIQKECTAETEDTVPGNLSLGSDEETLYSRTNWSDFGSLPSLQPRNECDFSSDEEEDDREPGDEMDQEDDFHSANGGAEEPQDHIVGFHGIEAIDIDPQSPEGMELNFEPIQREYPRDSNDAENDAPTPTKLPDNAFSGMHSLSPVERLMTRLCDLSREAKAPLYLVDGIVQIVQEESRNGLDLSRARILKRESFLGHMLSRFKVKAPEVVRVELEDAQPKRHVYKQKAGCTPPPADVQVVDTTKEKTIIPRPLSTITYVCRFLFRDVIKDIFSDMDLMADIRNFQGCVNLGNPFSRYFPPNGQLDEVVDAAWFQRTWEDCRNLCGHCNFLVIPLLIYLDKTGTDKFQRHAMEPLILMLAIFNRRCRNQDRFKRVLGYLPDLDNSSSASKNKSRSADRAATVRNYHRILKVIFDDIAEGQGWLKEEIIPLQIGNNLGMPRCFFPICATLQDNKSADGTTARVANHKGGRCPSRFCDISFEHLDKPYTPCKPPNYQKFRQASRKLLTLKGLLGVSEEQAAHLPTGAKLAKAMATLESYLESIDRHPVELATENCWFGSQNPTKIGENIFGAAPPDMMHIFLHGILRYAIKVYIVPMTDAEKAELDKHVSEVLCPIRSGEKKNFPRFSFVKGITNLTLITAEEWAGIALALVIVHQTEHGRDLFERVRYRREKNDELKKRKRNEEKEKATVEASVENTGSASDDEDLIRDQDTTSVGGKCTTGQLRPVGTRGKPRKRARGLKRHNRKGTKKTEVNNNNNSSRSKRRKRQREKQRKTNADGDLEELESDVICHPESFTYIMEMMLCFHAFYTQKEPIPNWKEEGLEENLKAAMQLMLHEITVHLPRAAGCGWNLQKFHDLLHLAYYMSEFGSAMNFDTGNGEHALKVFVKNIVHSCQQNRGQIRTAEQACKRIQVHTAINRALATMRDDLHSTMMARIRKDSEALSDLKKGRERRSKGVDDCTIEVLPEEDQETVVSPGVHPGPKIPKRPTFRLFLNHRLKLQDKIPGKGRDLERGMPIVRWCASTRTYTGGNPLHPAAVAYLSHVYRDPNTVIECHTEVTTERGCLFRAHPNYQRDGAWYDWAAIPWADNEEQAQSIGKPNTNFGCYGNRYFPAKVLCFFRCPRSDIIKAVIHSATDYYKTDSSVLTEVWGMDYDKDERRSSLDPWVYEGVPAFIPDGLDEITKRRYHRQLGMGARTCGETQLFHYALDTHPRESDPPEGCLWERHAPVISSTPICNLHHRLFVVCPEKTLADGRRDVVADPDANPDGLVYDGELDRSMSLEEIKEDSKQRLVPWLKRQAPTVASRKRKVAGGDTVLGKPCGTKVLVIPPRSTFWAKKFIDYGEKELLDPIALECMSDEEGTG
jgi:hypothetical protein